MPQAWECLLGETVLGWDSDRGQRPPANPTGSMGTQDTHACLPGEPARESPLLKAKVWDTETGTKVKGQGFVNCRGEDKHKRRETKSVGETVFSWILTASHFSAKENLASENMEIPPSYKVTLQKEEKEKDFSEGLPKRCTIILKGIRPANDEMSSGERAYAAFSLNQQICGEPRTVFPPGSTSRHMRLLTYPRAESQVHAPVRGTLRKLCPAWGPQGLPLWSQCGDCA